MPHELTKLSLDTPFTQQEAGKGILLPPCDGPVPQIVLYRLLGVAELAIKTELHRVSPEKKKKLLGLRVGYQMALGKEDLSEPISHGVGWGYLPQDELQPNEIEDEDQNDDEPDPEENSLSFKFFDKLEERLEQALHELTPSAALHGHDLSLFVYGTTNPCWFGYRCECKNAQGQCRKRRYYCSNGRQRRTCTDKPCSGCS